MNRSLCLSMVSALLSLPLNTASALDNTPTPEPLTASVARTVVATLNSDQITANGGVPPYRYYVSGTGTIDPVSGLFHASNEPGTATVLVMDSAGGSAEVSITVNPALEISPRDAVIKRAALSDFVAQGGVPPYQYSVQSGDCKVDSGNGHFAGSKLDSPCTVRVTDSAGNTSETTFELQGPGSYDRTFGDRGEARVPLPGDTGPFDHVFIHNGSGGVYALNTGYVGGPNAWNFLMVTEVAYDGRADGYFGTTGTRTIQCPDHQLECVPVALARQTDSIIVATNLETPRGQLQGDRHSKGGVLFKMSYDGVLDTNFGKKGSVDLRTLLPSQGEQVLSSMQVDDEGRIYTAVSSCGPAFSGKSCEVRIARLTPKGALDASFGRAGVVQLANSMVYSVVSMVIQKDKIAALSQLPGNGPFSVRLNVLDTTGKKLAEQVTPFYASSAPSCRAGKLAVGDSGRLYVRGSCETSLNGYSVSYVVLAAYQLEDDEHLQLDPSFGKGGLIAPPADHSQGFLQGSSAGSVLEDESGKILLTDVATDNQMMMTRLNHDGSTDRGFGNDGYATAGYGGVVRDDQGHLLSTDVYDGNLRVFRMMQ